MPAHGRSLKTLRSGAEASVHLRVYHSDDRRVPYAGPADGHDRRRSGPFDVHPCLRHLRDGHSQLGDGTCVYHGDRIYGICGDPDDHPERTD